jgi:hypothetical protein
MSCEGCEEGAYVIDALAKLLADIAVIVNGPEPPLTSWSYHDLPEKVRALRQAQQPAAAVPEGMVMVQRADIEALEAADFGRCGWSARADLAARRLRAAMLAAAERKECKV